MVVTRVSATATKVAKATAMAIDTATVLFLLFIVITPKKMVHCIMVTLTSIVHWQMFVDSYFDIHCILANVR